MLGKPGARTLGGPTRQLAALRHVECVVGRYVVLGLHHTRAVPVATIANAEYLILGTVRLYHVGFGLIMRLFLIGSANFNKYGGARLRYII